MAGCWHLRAEQGVLGRVAGIFLAGPGLFCRLSGPGSVPSFQEPAGTVAYSLLGVHWQLALTADPASTSPYPLTYARGQSGARYPQGDLLFVPVFPSGLGCVALAGM